MKHMSFTSKELKLKNSYYSSNIGRDIRDKCPFQSKYYGGGGSPLPCTLGIDALVSGHNVR